MFLPLTEHSVCQIKNALRKNAGIFVTIGFYCIFDFARAWQKITRSAVRVKKPSHHVTRRQTFVMRA